MQVLYELLVSSQQTLARELAEYMGVKIIGYNYFRKKSVTIYTIEKVFERIPMNRQFSIGFYRPERIGLYFSEHKLDFECDKYDHKYRDISYEINRQNLIEDQLNCKFSRYNPAAEDFTVERDFSIFPFI